MEEFIYKELSYEVIGCAFEAFKTVGVGFSELIYHKYFHDRLLEKGMNARYKVSVHLDYRSKRIADFEVDEIVEDKLIVDLKEIQTDFIPENYAQIIAYLKLTHLRLGLLINFGLHRAFQKRVIFDNYREEDTESWDEGFYQNLPQKSIIDSLIHAIRNVDKELGAGYHSDNYKSAVGIELDLNRIVRQDKVFINFECTKFKLNPFEIDYWMIENIILLGVLAGKDKPKLYDLFRMRSYLKHLNLHHGLIAYWSTKNLQLYGIYQP